MNRVGTLFFLAVITIYAAGYSRTNLQYLSGSGFDHLIGGDRVDGRMQTLTLEHYSTWGYGDNFFFVDSYEGDFDHFGTPKEYLLYMEWAPRLSLSKMSGFPIQGAFIKESYLSAQLNRGDNFSAALLGAGVDLDLPFFAVFGVNLYHRKDNFDNSATQLTLNWLMPLGDARFEGFLDRTDDEVIAQPQLLLDLALAGIAQDTLYVGAELYYYKRDEMTASVPQFMVKWIW